MIPAMEAPIKSKLERQMDTACHEMPRMVMLCRWRYAIRRIFSLSSRVNRSTRDLPVASSKRQHIHRLTMADNGFVRKYH
jgi:hypothetical protein